MSNIESLTEDLRLLSERYQPAPEIATIMQQHDLIMVVGPFVTGKTSIMQKAEELDPEFGWVRGFTTRDRRNGESEDIYDFLGHDEAALQNLKARALAGKLMQFAVHPATGNVYGSDVRSYNRPYSMLDTVSTVAERYAALPFRNVHTIGLTVPPDDWTARFRTRSYDSDPKEVQARLREGIHSIGWCLDQEDKVRWVINNQQFLANAARHMVGIARGEQEPSPLGRIVADSLRTRMRELLADTYI